ncbi:MAG TPA: hypothetical protein PLI58_07675, partial [Candidatus Syntrophosphaera sp.]|nr:hypothetical protein [Candidatus Syntrophosphaera sp.]
RNGIGALVPGERHSGYIWLKVIELGILIDKIPMLAEFARIPLFCFSLVPARHFRPARARAEA